jgi:hypothetical protein
LLIIAFALSASAYVSSPEGLAVASGDLTSSNWASFSVLGEGTVGILSGGSYISTIGLASVIFTPLASNAGEPVPRVNTAEVDIISYPNPFNPNRPESITIAYKCLQDVDVKVYFFDVTGQLMRTITISSSNRGPDGLSRVSWDGKSNFGDVVENGVYLVRIVSGGTTIAKTKVIVMK